VGELVKQVAVALIRAYQLLVSPCLSSRCIYSPSCSSYALAAYRRFGFWRGSALAARRLLRCWPWNAGGYDPIR